MYKSYTSDEVNNNIESFLELDKKFQFDSNGLYFSVENKNGLIGYVYFTKEDNDYYLKNIYIKEEKRYKSYGSKLLSFAINKKIKKGNLIVTKDSP
ncbi:MAG: GNAT family N-acetyltransferase, partial [Cetobacterium sp.]